MALSQRETQASRHRQTEANPRRKSVDRAHSPLPLSLSLLRPDLDKPALSFAYGYQHILKVLSYVPCRQ